MTENMKKFLELVSEESAEYQEKLNTIADKDEVIALAADKGVTLTYDDFTNEDDEGEVSLDEADAVAGGGECVCVIAGGGTPGYKDEACACVVGGWGETTYYGSRCHCPVGGYGYSRDE